MMCEIVSLNTVYKKVFTSLDSLSLSTTSSWGLTSIQRRIETFESQIIGIVDLRKSVAHH